MGIIVLVRRGRKRVPRRRRGRCGECRRRFRCSAYVENRREFGPIVDVGSGTKAERRSHVHQSSPHLREPHARPRAASDRRRAGGAGVQRGGQRPPQEPADRRVGRLPQFHRLHDVRRARGEPFPLSVQRLQGRGRREAALVAVGARRAEAQQGRGGRRRGRAHVVP